MSGQKARIVDTGNDSFGDGWYMWNNINALNGIYAEYCIYPFEDGWLDEFFPALWPVEGVTVNMSAKLIVKNQMLKMGWKHIVHMNANGVITVDKM